LDVLNFKFFYTIPYLWVLCFLIMRRSFCFSLLVFSFSLAYTTQGQGFGSQFNNRGFGKPVQQQDDGFTNIAEATNQTINHYREGKWIIYITADNRQTEDTAKAAFYSLRTYRHDTLNGHIHTYFKGGKLKNDMYYVNGLENGHEHDYYENGQLKINATVLNGKVDGTLTEYYDNGNLKQVLNYKNGLKDGPATTYYQDGKVDVVSAFVDDQQSGVTKEYYESGVLESEKNSVNGKTEGLVKIYYQSGKIFQEAYYVNGQPNGLLKNYFETGVVKETVMYTNGTMGLSTEYNEDGTVNHTIPGN